MNKSSTLSVSEAGRSRMRRRVGSGLMAVTMLVGLVGLVSPAQAAPGNLPAPLGQADKAGTGSLGCPAGAPWMGFDAKGGTFGPVAIAFNQGHVWVTDFRNSENGSSTAGKLFRFPDLATAQACGQPDRELDGLDQPEGIAFDANSNMYLSDTGVSKILKFTPTQLGNFTIAAAATVGTAPAVPTTIWFTGPSHYPRALTIGPDGKLYVPDDTANKVLVFDPAGADNQVAGVISSAANICSPKAVHFIGTSMFVVNYHDAVAPCTGVPDVVRLDSQALTTTATANATFVDHNAIDMTSFGTTLVVSSTDGNLTTFPTAASGTGARPAGTTVTSLGQNGVTGTYDLKGPTFGVASAAVDGNPTLVADSGNFRVLQVDLTPVKVMTTTTVASSKNPSAVGDSVTFTATVAPATGGTVPTGSVQFKVDGTALGGAIPMAAATPGIATPPSAGSATSPAISTLTAGTHTVTADYSGDPAFAVSQGTLTQRVTNVRVTSGPPVLVQIGSTDPIANVTLQELSAGALPMGTAVCIEGSDPFRPATATAPTVAASGGDGTAGAPTSANGRISIPITKTSTTATTYTVSGITMDPVGAPGPIFVSVGTACNQAAPDLATGLQPGFLGSEKRLSGSTRYATAEVIADTVEPLHSPAQPADCKGTVIVANGVNYPDALAASSLAGTSTPILLVADTVPTETAAAIRQHGVTHIIIVGGPSSVSNAIQSQFESQNATTCGGGGTTANKITTERVAGADRYATAKAVSERNGLGGAGTAPTADAPTCTMVKSAIVASGETFPDALAAGVLAAGGAICDNHVGGALPLLLTRGGSLDAFTQQALEDLGIKQVFVVGGTSTVSDTVLGQIRNVGGTNSILVKRISGSTRQGTAAALAGVMDTREFSFEGFQPDLDRYSGELLLTRGDTFPDALVGAPLGALHRAPLLLADSPTSLGTTAATVIAAYPRVTIHLLLLGGPDSLSQAVFNAAGTAMASDSRVPCC